MIKARDIAFTYNGAQDELFSALKFNIHDGEHIALTGPNGSGKSTLGYIIAGLYKPQRGTISIDNIEVTDKSNARSIRKKIGYIFQDPDNQMVTTSVRRELAFGPENLSIPPTEISRRIRWIIEYFELEELLDAPPNELSGGEKETVALASVLTMGPQIIILDEPTAYLDFAGNKKLWDVLERLNRDQNITTINITQSPDELAKADRVFYLNKGDLAIFPGNRADYPTSFNDYLSNSHYTNLNFQKNSSAQAVIKAQGVSFSYNGKCAVKSTDITINQGDQVGIVGAAGSGKSTLVHLIAELLTPETGTIKTIGRVGLVFQFPEKQFFEETVLRDVSFGPKNINIDQPEEKAKEYLNLVGIQPHHFQKPPFILSGGEQRRVAIASILAMEPDIVIFDEPTCGLDPYGTNHLLKIYQALIDNNKTILTISHDLNFTKAVTNRLIGLKKGKIIFDGPTNTALANSSLLQQLSIADKTL